MLTLNLSDCPPQVLPSSSKTKDRVVIEEEEDATLTVFFCSDPAPKNSYWEWGSLKLNSGAIRGRFKAEGLLRDQAYGDCFEARMNIEKTTGSDARKYSFNIFNEQGSTTFPVTLEIRKPVAVTMVIGIVVACIVLLVIVILIVVYTFKAQKLCFKRKPFAARGHVLGYHLATPYWRTSYPVNKSSIEATNNIYTHDDAVYLHFMNNIDYCYRWIVVMAPDKHRIELQSVLCTVMFLYSSFLLAKVIYLCSAVIIFSRTEYFLSKTSLHPVSENTQRKGSNLNLPHSYEKNPQRSPQLLTQHVVIFHKYNPNLCLEYTAKDAKDAAKDSYCN
ncbi:hypothetical protein GQR58_014110 [Nymphon striatum]|nr:hypothetical protein GQR58_014110 [Nymphon striatum]